MPRHVRGNDEISLVPIHSLLAGIPYPSLSSVPRAGTTTRREDYRTERQSAAERFAGLPTLPGPAHSMVADPPSGRRAGPVPGWPRQSPGRQLGDILALLFSCLVCSLAGTKTPRAIASAPDRHGGHRSVELGSAGSTAVFYS